MLPVFFVQSETLRQRVASGWLWLDRSVPPSGAAKYVAARPPPRFGQVQPDLDTDPGDDPLASVSEHGAAGNASAAGDTPPAPLEAVAKIVSQSLVYDDSPPGDVRPRNFSATASPSPHPARTTES